MSKAEFGRTVSILRKETRNEFDQPMTQNDLADLARMPLITLQKIEQGRQTNIKPDMALALANALDLTAIPRLNFLLSCLGLGQKDLARSRVKAQQILEDLHAQLLLLQVPAFIANCFGDLIYANSLFFEVLDISPQKLNSGHMLCKWNINRLFYSPEFEDLHHMMGAAYLPFARRQVFIFKALTMKYRSHWYLQKLLPELNHFPKFKQFWQSSAYQNEEVFVLTNPFTLNHPRYGGLSFLAAPNQALTEEIDLLLYAFMPADQPTARVCIDYCQPAGSASLSFNQKLVPPRPSLLT